MKSRSNTRPFPVAMSTPGMGLYKWTRDVPVPGKQHARTEVHSSGTFAGLASEAPGEGLRRGIRAEDGWALVRA